MKIAIVTNILTPYRAVFFEKLYNHLVAVGDELRVYSMCKEKGDRPWKYDDLKTEYTELIKGFKFRINRVYIYFNDPYYQLKDYSPDVVICAGAYWLPTTIKVLYDKKKLGYKTFMWSESHEKEIKNNSIVRNYLSKLLRRYSLPKFDGFLYASDLAKSMVIKYAKKDAIYISLPNTVNQDEFKKALWLSDKERKACRHSLNIPDGNTVFFIAARLSPEKGILNFLNILNQVDSKDRVTLLIAGSGPLKTEIEYKARNWGLNVCLLGQKSQDDIIKLLGISDFFLLPSLSDPNPLTVIEALWAGRPLLISDGVGNQNEAIRSGKNGFVFSYSNTESIVQVTETLINSSHEWRAGASNISRAIAEEVYDVDKVVDNLVTALKNIFR